MDDLDLPDDLKDSVEVVYLDDDEEIEEYGDAEPIETGDEEEDDIRAEVIDMSKLTFAKHTKSVFYGDLSADGALAVTGGEDDVAYIWSTTTCEVLLECTGHKDSVTEVRFNHDNEYVATGDMGGLIQVWNVQEKKLVWCFEGDDLEWLTWHHLANVLVAGTQSGDVYVWQIPQGNCKVLASHGSPTTCGKILPDGKRLVAGYGDGQIKLWDIKSALVLWQVTDLEEIVSLDVSGDGSLLAVAPNSQIIKLSDGKIIGQFLQGGNSEVEALTFNDELGILVTGSLSGQLCVWDVRKQMVRHQAKLEASVTSLKWGLDTKLLVGTNMGAIYVCDVRTGTLVGTLTGHREDVLSMCVSRDKLSVLSTSDDHTAKIFTIIKAD